MPTRPRSLRKWIAPALYPAQRLVITTGGGNAITVDGEKVTLEGKAPVDIAALTVLVDGSTLADEPPHRLSDSDFFGWTIAGVPLHPGENAGEVLGFTREGVFLDRASIAVRRTSPGVGPYLCGDCDGDGEATGEVSDLVYLLQYLFLRGEEPGCLSACDFDGDGAVPVSTGDALFAINFNFLGGPAPRPPFPVCGMSQRTQDVALGCGEAQGCR
jgi:hypothetical protein